MKVTKDILEVLQNFQRINKHIIFEKGDTVKTVSPSKNVFAIAKTTLTFPQEICIYDLVQLTNILSVIDEPEIEFHDTYMEIKREKYHTRYNYSEPEVMTTVATAKKLNLKMPSCDVVTKISTNDIKVIERMCGLLDKPSVCISYRQNHLYMKTFDVRNQTANEFKQDMELSSISTNNFDFVLNINDIDFVKDEYVVNISKSGLIEFIGPRATYVLVGQKGTNFL